ncbi:MULTISPECIES: hypothetical protein [unclassified Roseitalea]|uniref:hypothetical protein n=1 Tax=unclassified Roseitalea TaxID=2639107 RepID=UPI00273DD9CD|nr:MULTISPECIES: hypothetical protein [unclassified Roseitalea]
MARHAQDPQKLKRSDLADDEMGNNELQGNDQANVRNQRQAVPDVKQEPDDNVIDSFEKMDKHERARRDLGARDDRDDRDDGKA